MLLCLGLWHCAPDGKRGRNDRSESVGGGSDWHGCTWSHLGHLREHLRNANRWFNKLGTWGFKNKRKNKVDQVIEFHSLPRVQPNF